MRLNVTDTASSSSSLLMDLQVGGTSRFIVSKSGSIIANGSNSVTVDGANGIVSCRTTASNGFSLSFSQFALGESTPMLFRDVPNGLTYTGLFSTASGTLEQRNGTAAQTLRVYNTFTNASNYERLSVDWSSNVAYIRPQNAGSGSARLFVPVTGSTTVASLPAAATAGAGARAFVTDATVTTFASTVAGGGANGVPVVSNGTNWIIG
jgi:hypothetical protein